MSEAPKRTATRREFLKTTGRVAAVSALAGMAIPQVHAAEDNTLRVALIGCGGRAWHPRPHRSRPGRRAG